MQLLNSECWVILNLVLRLPGSVSANQRVPSHGIHTGEDSQQGTAWAALEDTPREGADLLNSYRVFLWTKQRAFPFRTWISRGHLSTKSFSQKWRKKSPSAVGLEGGWDQPGRGRVLGAPSLLSPAWRQLNPHLLAHPAELSACVAAGPEAFAALPVPRGAAAAERRERSPGPRRIWGCSKIRSGKHRGSKPVPEKPNCFLNFPLSPLEGVPELLCQWVSSKLVQTNKCFSAGAYS